MSGAIPRWNCTTMLRKGLFTRRVAPPETRDYDVIGANDPFVQAVLSARNRRELARLLRRVATGPPVRGVSVHLSLLLHHVVTELHRHVEVVMTWPVNDVAALDTALALGASGIISDESSVLAELLSRRQTGT